MAVIPSTLVRGCSLVAAAVTLSACGTPIPETPPAQSRTGGYGDAVAALLVAPTESAETRAHLLLVRSNGRFRTVPAVPLDGVVPVPVNGSVQVAGPTDLRVTAHSTVLTAHAWEDASTAVASTAAGDVPWTLLQRGSGGVVVAGEGDTASRGEFDSLPSGLTGCGRDALGLLPSPAADTVRLARYRTERLRVVEQVTELPLTQPVTDVRVACHDDDPLVLARTKAGPVIGSAAGGTWAWHSAPNEVGAAWGTVIGTVGDLIVLQGRTGARTFDVSTRRVTEVVGWPRDSGKASVSGHRLVVWQEADSPLLSVHDVLTGEVTASIDTTRIAARLGDEGRVVRGAPVLLGDDT